MASFMVLTDGGQVKCFSLKNGLVKDARDRSSVGCLPLGTCGFDQAFQELKQADDAEASMEAWTTTDPPAKAGSGVSGEAIASDGIEKGHAYSLACAGPLQADSGEAWPIVRLRNAGGANTQSEGKGELSDDSPGSASHLKLNGTLQLDHAGADGLTHMRYVTLLDRFSDNGIQPVATRLGGKSVYAEAPLICTQTTPSVIEGFSRKMPKCQLESELTTMA